VPNEFVELKPRNIRIWFALAFQAGAVNAGGFLACKRFVTHTTGFATHFATELATHHEGAAIGMLSVPVFFLLGAMGTSYFVDLRITRGQPARYGVPAFLVFLCLSLSLLLGVIGKFGDFQGDLILRKDLLLLGLLSLASGLQNALITNSEGIVVRTTHLTGITTDLATGIVRTLFRGHRRDPGSLGYDRLATITRGGIIASFVAGSTVSAYLYLRVEFWGFALPVLTSLALWFYFLQRNRRLS
jgi:uncharacterized membrane protein YoaK (UPF0700 family)